PASSLRDLTLSATMRLERENGSAVIVGQTYRLQLAPDRPFVYLYDAGGTRVAELFVLSSVHSIAGRDDTIRTGAWDVQESPDEIVCTLRAESSIWEGKRYMLRCRPRRLRYEIEVEGEGRLAEVNYFGGYFSGFPRWGSGFFWSGQHFKRGFTPEPNGREAQFFAPGSGEVIDLLGVPLPGKDHWFFTPAPFCFAFEVASGWLGLGAEARPGENRFTEYRYVTQSRWFHLSLSYEGYTRVEGRYRLPAIGFDFGSDPFEALAAHVEALGAAGEAAGGAGSLNEKNLPQVPKPAGWLPRQVPAGGVPGWWREPIFCGWGAQCGLAVTGEARAPEYARQEVYEGFLRILEEHGISPGIVVLDDTWQATYGENRADERKWPDVRGFIAEQHARGRRVLLWLKAWDPEGLPAEECIRNAGGLPVAFDPSNPAFERRLRSSIRLMLSSDGYDADGFKIDFSARIPSGPGMQLHGEIWGLELMKHYLGILYEEAKRVKPDALVMTHTPHPYLADVLDMIRLNDMMDLNRLHQPEIGTHAREVMALRARIARIACPGAVIDTDSWPIRDKALWRTYAAAQPALGVPSLYFVDRVDLSGEAFEAEDYALIRETWAEYRELGGESLKMVPQP
ncbi:MAG TPA: hypothetical protein VER55_16780, partial [Ardenticatenaceae bacterium]|nr:hypothetical protein [Ardenticatenaceae bacterium]